LSGVVERNKEIHGVDGLITNTKGVFLVAKVADCQAVMLYDPTKSVTGMMHVGWGSSVAGIISGANDRTFIKIS